MPNELQLGTRRTGDLYDSYENTPEVKVTLERSDAGLSLTVAWSNDRVPYAAWFLSNGGFIRGTEPRDALPVPRRVVFHDSHGYVLLIRCWARGYHANSFGPGSGTLWARAAIMGVGEDVEFDRPHGLQSEISGLREWLGITSWIEDVPERSPVAVTIKSVNHRPIHVCERNGVSLELRSDWRLDPPEGDRRILHDVVRCATHSNEPLAWDAHMQLHRAVRDLLVISRWRQVSCVPVYALRKDDPLTTLDGKTHGEQWRDVVVREDERTPSDRGWYPHLILFDELGVGGLDQWIAVRNEYARALDPVITSMDLTGATPKTLLAHTGPGLEALGYLLMISDGATESQAKRANLRTRLDRILTNLGDVLPFSGSEWADRTVEAYNGLKHANRAMPDEVDVITSWAESVMVVRAWVALRLGVTREAVQRRLRDDRQPRRFERVH